MKRRRTGRGQVSLEYMLVIGAVLAALVTVVVTMMTPAVSSSLEDSRDVIQGATDNLADGLGL